jgi:hypothetical protein
MPIATANIWRKYNSIIVILHEQDVKTTLKMPSKMADFFVLNICSVTHYKGT